MCLDFDLRSVTFLLPPEVSFQPTLKTSEKPRGWPASCCCAGLGGAAFSTWDSAQYGPPGAGRWQPRPGRGPLSLSRPAPCTCQRNRLRPEGAVPWVWLMQMAPSLPPRGVGEGAGGGAGAELDRWLEGRENCLAQMPPPTSLAGKTLAPCLPLPVAPASGCVPCAPRGPAGAVAGVNPGEHQVAFLVISHCLVFQARSRKCPFKGQGPRQGLRGQEVTWLRDPNSHSTFQSFLPSVMYFHPNVSVPALS